jgi:hypothetical protein
MAGFYENLPPPRLVLVNVRQTVERFTEFIVEQASHS